MKEYENNIEDHIKAKIKTKVDDPVPYLEGIEDDVKLLQTKAKNNLLVNIRKRFSILQVRPRRNMIERMLLK